jgi:hypothetical protein
MLIDVKTKTCKVCGKTKPLTFDHFYRSKQTKSGFRPRCKPCVNDANKAYNRANPDKAVARTIRSRNMTPERKAAHVRRVTKSRHANYEKHRDTAVARQFGVPKGWFLEQIERTGGCCEICGVEHRSELHPRYLSVDHCHKTDEVRGLLCGNCNFGLGHFKDNVQMLEAAIRYLKERS